jgi:arginyl-tRNA synthetase
MDGNLDGKNQRGGRRTTMMGYSAQCEHVGFGMMLGADGKPFRTRDGGTIRLESLLDEAEDHIRPIISAKWPAISEQDLRQLSSQVGVGAVKYADLMHNLDTDYRFEWESVASTLRPNRLCDYLYGLARAFNLFYTAHPILRATGSRTL